MEIARELQEVSIDLSKGSCVTIGNFDGVHVGHRRLIERTRKKAAQRGMSSVVVTFCPHPLRVLVGPHTPPLITDYEKKLDLLELLGVDLTLMLRFTKQFAAKEPDDFVRTVLVEGLNTRELVVGYDFSLGKGRRGNAEMLARLGEQYGFGVEQLEPVIVNDAVVSSTRIRDLIRAGDVWDVRPLLERSYVVRGKVVPGKNRGGKLLGFPTANLQVVDELLPKPGVYAVWVEVDGEVHPAVTNIGTNPTFGDTGMTVEVHILDFDRDIYGWEVKVAFVQRLRDECRFPGLDALIAQIRHDVALSRQILAAPEAHY